MPSHRSLTPPEEQRLKDAEAALKEVMTFPRTPFPSDIAKRYFEKWGHFDKPPRVPEKL